MKSTLLFSVHINTVQVSLTYEEYISHVDQVSRGVHRLLKPLNLHHRAELRRRIEHDDTPSEWMDVWLKQCAQLDFLTDLEDSLGSDLTLLKIEQAAAVKTLQFSTRQLQHFMHRRVWRSAEFLDLTHKIQTASGVIALGQRFPIGPKTVTIRYPSGNTDVTTIPNRRTSAVTEERYDLTFKPLLIGLQSASVRLCSLSRRTIGVQSKPIPIHWAAHLQPDWSTRMIIAMKNQEWITCGFRLVKGSTGAPKSLLLTSSF